MNQVKITTALLSEMSDLSTVNKLVYIILITKANPIGIVNFNPVEIAALASVDKYHFSDLRVFGDRIVDLGGGEILLTRYLREQWGRLSRKCPPHKTVFNLLWQRWGTRLADGSEPFLAEWKRLGIAKYAPLIAGEYHGESEKLPDYLVEAREATKDAIAKTSIPSKWPEAVKSAAKAYFDFRDEKIMQCRGVSDSKEWTLTFQDAKQVIRLIQSWIDGGALPHAIDSAITNAVLGKFKGFFAPKLPSKISKNEP